MVLAVKDSDSSQAGVRLLLVLLPSPSPSHLSVLICKVGCMAGVSEDGWLAPPASHVRLPAPGVSGRLWESPPPHGDAVLSPLSESPLVLMEGDVEAEQGRGRPS